MIIINFGLVGKQSINNHGVGTDRHRDIAPTVIRATFPSFEEIQADSFETLP